MKSPRRRGVVSLPILGIALALGLPLGLSTGAPAAGQLQVGNLYGKVTDQNGTQLPGVTITLTGKEAEPVLQVTNQAGAFRLLGLSPGAYSLKAELEGFSTVVQPNIVIKVGQITNVKLTLKANQ
jgi:hypothetical protein